MERKTLKFELKALDEETGIFEGYASVFSKTPDTYGDVVEPGAFTKTLAEGGRRVKVLWNHSVMEPIGKPLEMKEDAHGLWVKGKLSLGVQRAREVLSLMKDDVINELSIGYDAIIAPMQQGVRHLKEVRLWDFSPVTFAAEPGAMILSVKEENMDDIKALPDDLPEEDVQPLTDLEDTLKGLVSFTEEDMADLDNEDLDGLIECIDIFLEPTKGGPGSGPRGGGGRARRAGQRLLGKLRKKRSGLLSELRTLRTMKLSSPRSEGVRKDMIKGAQTQLASVRGEMVGARRKNTKSGRVLSAANMGKVQAAFDALQALLEIAAGDGEPDKSTPPPDEKSLEAAELDVLLAQMEAEVKGSAHADAVARIDDLIRKMEVVNA